MRPPQSNYWVTTTDKTTVYTCPSETTAIIKSIRVSEDSGNNDTIAAKSYTKLMKHPGILKLGTMILTGLQKPFLKGGVISSVPIPPLSIWTRSRDLPKLPDKTFHQIWKDGLKDNQDNNG